jgi:predicted TIM-barrel fold metal-dependent hydrolase
VRLVTLEEHCLTPALREVLGEQIHPYYPVHRWPAELEAKLSDIGAGRIAELDGAGIDLQVLSTVQPGLEHIAAERATVAARSFNDDIAAAIAAHPTRLAGFAALPSADPQASARELERAVQDLGLVGAMVNGRTLERFLDDQFFWPIFEAAESLGVPLYLHPMPPPKAVYDLYYAGFGDAASFMLAAGAWGWHVEIGLHALRLMLAGVFDRFPAVQIIIGHMGEVLPFMIDRASGALRGAIALDAFTTQMQLTPSEYLRRNFHITTSGFFSDPPLRCAIDVIGADRVMFSVDSPFSDNAKGAAFIRSAALSDSEREQISHANAERLLGIQRI